MEGFVMFSRRDCLVERGKVGFAAVRLPRLPLFSHRRGGREGEAY